jgi:competence protein ComEC
MDEVVKAMKPRYFVASRSGHSTSLYLKLLRTVEAQGLTVVHPSTKPRKIELGTVEMTLFPQPPEDRKEENNNSIGLRMSYGSFSVLFTGDSEEAERAWWLRNDPSLVRNCTILKLAHHGSRNGTDAHWLQVVRPDLAVASMGRNNEYGHPHSETVSLLRRTGIPMLRTDQLGTITITSDGRDWSVMEPALGRAGRPTQADVDRVAAATENAPARDSSRTRTR